MQPHNNLRCMCIGSSNFIFDDASSPTDMHNVSIYYAVGISYPRGFYFGILENFLHSLVCTFRIIPKLSICVCKHITLQSKWQCFIDI